MPAVARTSENVLATESLCPKWRRPPNDELRRGLTPSGSSLKPPFLGVYLLSRTKSTFQDLPQTREA